MAIDAQQREARRKFIGSSDCAAICGLDPYASPADVWLVKTGRADDFAGNEATDRGTLLEPVVLAWAESEIGHWFARDQMSVGGCGLLAANFDGRSPDDIAEPFLVEGKTTVNADEWGEPGTDQVPERVICQTHHQFGIAGPGYRVCWVPVLLPGFKSFDFRLYRVDRDDALADALADRCRRFMLDHVRADVRPDDYRPSLEVLKRVRREPDKVADGLLADAVVDEWVAARDAAPQAEKRKAAADAAVLAAMGDAEGAPCHRGLVTYMETKRAGYTVAPTAYRSLRLKIAKEAKCPK